MSIEALNEQLLRAVGVGIALFDETGARLRFRNDAFAEWFGAEEGAALADLMPGADVGALVAQTRDGTAEAELKLRPKRRQMVFALALSRAATGAETLLLVEVQNITRIRELEAMIESYAAMTERNAREIRREKEQVERLLLNIMPRAAYEEFKAVGVVQPARYTGALVLTVSLMGLAEAFEALPPADFARELTELYGAFDAIGEHAGFERIRTTGDTYLSVSGLQDGGDPAEAAATALRFLSFVETRNANAARSWSCRIGLGRGDVIGSVVGTRKYVYDLFGPAVDEAAAAAAGAAPMEARAGPLAAAALPPGTQERGRLIAKVRDPSHP